jgi:hypothetical protein
MPKDNAFYFPEGIKMKPKLKNSRTLADEIDHLLSECNNQ